MAQYKMVDTKGGLVLSGIHKYNDLAYLGQQYAREELARAVLYDYYTNPKKYARTNYKATIRGVESRQGGQEETVREIREYCYKQLERELRKRDRFFRASGSEVFVTEVPDKEGLYVHEPEQNEMYAHKNNIPEGKQILVYILKDKGGW